MVFRTAVFLKQISFLKTELTSSLVQFLIKNSLVFFLPVQYQFNSILFAHPYTREVSRHSVFCSSIIWYMGVMVVATATELHNFWPYSSHDMEIEHKLKVVALTNWS